MARSEQKFNPAKKVGRSTIFYLHINSGSRDCNLEQKLDINPGVLLVTFKDIPLEWSMTTIYTPVAFEHIFMFVCLPGVLGPKKEEIMIFKALRIIAICTLIFLASCQGTE